MSKILYLLVVLLFTSGVNSECWEPCAVDNNFYFYVNKYSYVVGINYCLSSIHGVNTGFATIENCNDTDPHQAWQHLDGAMVSRAGYYLHGASLYLWPRKIKAGALKFYLECDGKLRVANRDLSRACASVLNAHRGAGTKIITYDCNIDPPQSWQLWRTYRLSSK